MNSELDVGIVFSGGFAKGAYEIGFCKAILEYIKMKNIKAVSGASIGALNAYGFINNRLDYLCDIWKSLEFNSAREFFIKQNKRDIIYDYISGLVCANSETSDSSCYLNYIKVPNVTLCYKDVNKEEQNVQRELLKASIAVPTLYKPIFVQDNYYIDGAFLDNSPITPLQNENLDLIFVLRFDHASENYLNLNTDATIIEIVFEDDKKLNDYFYFNKKLTKRLIHEGYKQSKAILENVFKFGSELEYIKSVANVYNKESNKNFFPRSGEEVVSKINKLNRIFKKEYFDLEKANKEQAEILL
jgi:NTE family protein